jgi:exo-beta-1,3-glucanase (GH17 family)/cellulose synthase/poly-beta-1,6-N-acetylglucosamine synthase-like glycosyltransferase
MRSVAFVVALVACVHAGLWAMLRDQADAPGFDGQFPSLSYAPYEGSAHPDKGDRANAARIRADMRLLSSYTRAVRTYSSTGGVELVPGIAAEAGLKVTVGAWIDKDEARNERETRAVIDLARRHLNVDGIVVGNETIFRGEQNVDDLIKRIQRVKRESQVPVTTGEIWHVWMEHPELASAVDFIAAHILPYWEGFSEAQAVDQAMLIYSQLRQAYPGKRIVIAEFGWPSAGYNLKNANPGRLAQAQVLRDFVTRADALGIDYNIVEAFDQPWKIFEGGVGPYWGIFDASRAPKFAWTGPLVDADHWKLMGIAVLVGVLLSLPILGLAGATLGQAVTLATATHIVGAWAAAVFAYAYQHYLVPGAIFALVLGLILLVPLVLIMLARIDEIAAIAFGPKPRRLLASPPLAPAGYGPKVSLHIPAYREPPEMLKATLDAIARLHYTNFECIVIINNTPDPAFWMPVEEHCRTLGERFKFVRDDNVEGFKAGALRIALAHTASDAEIIGVLDADYMVTPDWLSDLVPGFADPKVGLIQAPQDHRDGNRSVMHHAMQGEYSGFFDIGMVQRNEANAIVVHGTMCLVRRTALERAGGWSSDTICEDTDLGLSILEQGWTAHYTNKRYGFGLLPDTFEGFKKQRHRWAYGGFQIVKKHWRRFLPGASQLTREQKHEFLLGWLNWLGAETLGVIVVVLNLLWVPVVAFAGIAIPDKILTIPIFATFAVTLLHFVALYRLRVAIPGAQTLGAVFAAMSVQWTVARAIGDGVLKEHLPFVRTPKGGARRRPRDFEAFWEAVLGALLILGAITLVATNRTEVREINIFAGVLVIQSLPFLAAALMAAIDGTRANEFATWQNLGVRAGELVRRRRAAIAIKAQAPAEKQIETVP